MKTISELVDHTWLMATSEAGLDLSISDVKYILTTFLEGMSDGVTEEDKVVQRIADAVRNTPEQGP